jgi:hypothetical protein
MGVGHGEAGQGRVGVRAARGGSSASVAAPTRPRARPRDCVPAAVPQPGVHAAAAATRHAPVSRCCPARRDRCRRPQTHLGVVKRHPLDARGAREPGRRVQRRRRVDRGRAGEDGEPAARGRGGRRDQQRGKEHAHGGMGARRAQQSARVSARARARERLRGRSRPASGQGGGWDWALRAQRGRRRGSATPWGMPETGAVADLGLGGPTGVGHGRGRPRPRALPRPAALRRPAVSARRTIVSAVRAPQEPAAASRAASNAIAALLASPGCRGGPLAPVQAASVALAPACLARRAGGRRARWIPGGRPKGGCALLNTM